MVIVYWTFFDEAEGKEKRKAEHEAGLSLLAYALKERYGISQGGKDFPEILKEPHGKPYLSGCPLIHFNISHGDGLAACGVGKAAIGVDVERVRPYGGGLPEKVLSKEELEQLEKVGGEGRQELFYKFWTLKECYLKAEGQGITVPLPTISFRILSGGEICFKEKGWSFWQQRLAGNHILSVCSKKGEGRPLVIEKDCW